MLLQLPAIHTNINKCLLGDEIWLSIESRRSSNRSVPLVRKNKCSLSKVDQNCIGLSLFQIIVPFGIICWPNAEKLGDIFTLYAFLCNSSHLFSQQCPRFKDHQYWTQTFSMLKVPTTFQKCFPAGSASPSTILEMLNEQFVSQTKIL